MRVDAHHHVWDLRVLDQPWSAGAPALQREFGFAELRPQLTACRIDATILVQTGVPAETPEFLALASAEPTIAGVVGWVDLTALDVADQLAHLRLLPGGEALVGIRHQAEDEPDPLWLCRQDVQRGLAAVGEAGLVFDLLVQQAQRQAALESVRALPQVRFVLDHGGNPDVAVGEHETWRTWTLELAKLPNVTVKLSGLVTRVGPSWTVADLRPYAETLLEAFGPDRVMFGSDWPVCTLAASYEQVVSAAEQLVAGLEESARAAVFGRTAARWYGISA